MSRISIDDFSGGVIGGSIIKGTLELNDIIEIRPGLISKNENDIQYRPIITKIISLKTENNSLVKAIPGGLIGVGTLIDPFLTKDDRMKGQIIGKVGCLPPVFNIPGLLIIVSVALY